MKIITHEQFSASALAQEVDQERIRKIDETVLKIIDEVRKNGDKALYDYAETFDGVKLEQLTVSEAEWLEAEKLVSASFIEAIKKAKENIASFHERQLENSWLTFKDDGIILGQKVTPMDRVGIYVPGGKAAYPSTVLMNAIPAKIANVPEIFIATPPQKDGKINPHVLVAAKIAGVDTIYRMGGAQAIAAFAYG